MLGDSPINEETDREIVKNMKNLRDRGQLLKLVIFPHDRSSATHSSSRAAGGAKWKRRSIGSMLQKI